MLSSSLFVFPDNVLANAITSRSTKQHVLEEGKVTISCNYSGSNINSLQWYRQSSNTAPEFLLQAFEGLGPQQKDRYVAEAQKNEKQLDLKISKTEIADSAVYYCALVPTVTGNPSTLYKNLRYDSHIWLWCLWLFFLLNRMMHINDTHINGD